MCECNYTIQIAPKITQRIFSVDETLLQSLLENRPCPTKFILLQNFSMDLLYYCLPFKLFSSVAFEWDCHYLSRHQPLRKQILVHLQTVELIIEEGGDWILYVSHCEVKYSLLVLLFLFLYWFLLLWLVLFKHTIIKVRTFQIVLIRTKIQIYQRFMFIAFRMG